MRQQRTAAQADLRSARWIRRRSIGHPMRRSIRNVIGPALGAALALGVNLMTATPAEAATCTFTGAAGGSWTVASNWSCGAVPGSADQAIVPAPGQVVLEGDAFVTTLVNNGTLTIQGTSHLGQTVTNAGIIIVNGTGESTIRRLTNNGVFNVNTGTLVAGANNTSDTGQYTVAAGATLRFGLVNGFDNGIRTFSGNMSVAGTLGFTFAGFTATAGTITFNSGATQTFLNQAAVSFFNVVVTPGTTLIESSIVGSTPQVTGTLTNQGRIRHVLPVPLDIPNIPHFFGLTGVRMDVASAGSLSSLQVERVSGSHPNADATVGAGEFWTITPTGAGFNLSLTLPHAVTPATAASVCRFTGTTWNCQVSSATATTVTRADITALSDWAVGNGAPISPPEEPPPPPPTFTRYFAEGATGTFFDTSIALLNPTTEAAQTTLKFLKQDGVTVTHALNIPALTRATVNPETLAGLEGASIATVVESTQPIVADRTMRWDPSGYGSHAETSIAQPLTTWYLAEGATTGRFNLYYLLQNPGGQAAEVEIRYLLPAPAAPVVKTYIIAANSRHSIYVNDEAPELGEAEISAVVTSKNGVPVIVERAMYLDANNQLFGAGHASAAVANPSTSWFFAEGATGPFFNMYLLIANPNAQAAEIEARYLLSSGQVVTKSYNVAGNSRFTIGVHAEGADLATAAVSTTLTSVNNVPVLAERTMWWPSLSIAPEWQEAHNSAGATQTGEKWALADGEDGGAFGTQTYVLIANTSATSGQARVTLHFEDGTSAQLANPIALDPHSRTTVQIGTEIPQAANRRFGIVVESLGATPAQIVVERAMYSNATINGVPVIWAAGTNVVGTRLR
jgi:hypothetical protein